jgi:iron complex outermembrane recepter protein
MGTDLIPMNTLKGAVHLRRDYHWEQALDFDPNDKFTGYEPRKKLAEEDWSFAIENTFHATRYFDVVTGVSYDTNQVLRADGTKFPLPDLEKWNWQGAAIYRYSRDGSVHADVSSRTRFPTLFDRYSTRFGGRTEEPDLNAERATNYELGCSDRLFEDPRSAPRKSKGRRRTKHSSTPRGKQRVSSRSRPAWRSPATATRS